MSIIRSVGDSRFMVAIDLRDGEGKTQSFGFVADSRGEACEKLGQWLNDNFNERLHPTSKDLEGLHACLPSPACPSCS